mgnify:CR=1 FL=1|tara:strand:- start:58 stop:465 length:408 start_codon:yes stop_codon:yes gene_type:complete
MFKGNGKILHATIDTLDIDYIRLQGFEFPLNRQVLNAIGLMRIFKMKKLNAEQRKARDNERFSQRVDERRVKGEDVVAYALANNKAFKFLTKSEKHSFKERQATQQEEANLKAQQQLELKEQQELDKAQAEFTQE